MNVKYLAVLTIAAALLAGCRSAEQKHSDYTNAYKATVKAIEKKHQDDNDLTDEELLAMKRASYPKFQIVAGEQVRVMNKFVKLSAEQEGITLKRFNAVAAEFRQLFNARSLASRLRDAGYDGTFVVETKEPIYYVVIATTATAEEALEAVKRLAADDKVVKKEPYPLILNAGNVKNDNASVATK